MSSRDLEQTYYEILEISVAAPHHEIVAAYQRAKEAYAPESPALYTMFTQEEAAELRSLVETAFLILGNQSKRKEYDQVLLSKNMNLSPNDLPDFAPAPVNVNIASNKKSNSMTQTQATAVSAHANTIPNGFAKSRFSVYEVKPEFESEILKQQVFDGSFIRKVRLYKNINTDQLSKETRISRSYLAAIEAEDYEALPAPVFLRGFIIQVARMLGLNENIVANSYMSRVKKDS